jgi:hypothetical protein
VFMKIHSGEKRIKFWCVINDLGTYMSVCVRERFRRSANLLCFGG